MNQLLSNHIKRNNAPPPRFVNTRITSSSSGYSGTSVIGIIIVVVVLILLIGASYWLYQFYSNRTFQTSMDVEALPDVKDAASNFNIGKGSIPSSNYSNEYSISMWINIDNYTYNYGKEKTILARGPTGSGNPEILLDKNTNDLIVRLKLQGPAPSNKLTVSKFADIPIQLQTHQGDNHEPSDKAYIHSTETGLTNILDPKDSLNKLGSNVIDYPTIHYNISAGCDNVLTTMKPEDTMTIMLEQATRIKENFNSTYKGDSQSLARVDIAKLSDNSAPVESQVFHNEYFAQISGNEISGANKLKENFDAVADITDASVAVLTDMCNLAKALQSQSNADNQVSLMNSAFQMVIDSLENSRKNANTGDDITKVFDNSMSNLSASIEPTTTIIPLLNNLNTNLFRLQTVSANSGTNVDLKTIQNAVNSKLAAVNCPLTLSGTNEVDIAVNFYENFLNMFKKSIYAYLSNMSFGIQQAYPQLATNQSASCIVNAATNSDPTVGTCIYRSIPLQRWVHVGVSVYNQVVDIFIDGQLASSCVLKGFPALSTNDVQITPNGGFAGKISRVSFSNSAMTVQKARKLYYDGPVPSSSIWSMIPNWVWYGIIFLIIIGIGYSFLM